MSGSTSSSDSCMLIPRVSIHLLIHSLSRSAISHHLHLQFSLFFHFQIRPERITSRKWSRLDAQTFILETKLTFLFLFFFSLHILHRRVNTRWTRLLCCRPAVPGLWQLVSGPFTLHSRLSLLSVGGFKCVFTPALLATKPEQWPWFRLSQLVRL